MATRLHPAPDNALPDATIPEAALGEPKDQYGAMREVVLHRIVEARMYREVDLRRFLKQACPPCHAPALPACEPAHAAADPTLAPGALVVAQVLSKNKQLDQTKLQAVVRDVEREFFLAA